MYVLVLKMGTGGGGLRGGDFNQISDLGVESTMSDFEPASVFLTLLQGHLSNCSISSTPSNQP